VGITDAARQKFWQVDVISDTPLIGVYLELLSWRSMVDQWLGVGRGGRPGAIARLKCFWHNNRDGSSHTPWQDL